MNKLPLIWSRVNFKKVLTIYTGDTVELDWKHKKAMVVSSAGKVRSSTEFTAVMEVDNGTSTTVVESDNGTSTTTGPGQD